MKIKMVDKKGNIVNVDPKNEATFSEFKTIIGSVIERHPKIRNYASVCKEINIQAQLFNFENIGQLEKFFMIGSL